MDLTLLKFIAGSCAGEKAKSIIDLLYGKKKVDEFLIAKKLRITVNQARNLLYKLADVGMVSFTKKKDRKKGGWYKYSWSLNEDRSLLKTEEYLLKAQERLLQQIEHKKKERFYACPNGDLDMQEEDALLHNYTCPECGEVLHIKDYSKEITAFEKEVSKNEIMLADVKSEIQLLAEKHGKIINRKQRLEEKKKKDERSAQRKERFREKEKERKKNQKKRKPFLHSKRKKAGRIR